MKTILGAIIAAILSVLPGHAQLTVPPPATTGYCYYAAGNTFLPIAGGASGGVSVPTPPPASTVYGYYSGGPNYQPLQCDANGNLIISSARVINGVSYQANYPQSDFGGRANACISDAETLANGNTTHICNAQGDTSTSASPAYILSQVNCGDTNGDPVTWILPYGYIHMSGFSGGTSYGILRYTGCRMMTQAPLVASSTLGNIGRLRIIDTSSGSGLYAMYGEATVTGSVSPYSEMSGIQFDSNGNSLANSSNAVIILNIGNDRSYDHDFDVTYAVAGQIGILWGGSSSSGTATCCSYTLRRITTNGVYTGGTGLAIQGYLAQGAVYDSTFGHTATGYPEITCNNVSPSQVQVDFFNIYGEESHDTTTPFVQDNGCTRLSFHGVTARPGAVNSTAPFLSMVSNDGAWTIDGLSMTALGSDTFTYPATAVSNAVSGSNCASAPGTPCLLKTDANGQLGEWAYNPGQGYNKQQTCGVNLWWGGGAIPAGTYTVPAKCFNNFGTTYYISGVTGYSDNAGTSTCNAQNNSGTALLTGAITVSPSWVAGTQSTTTSIPNGSWTTWTFVADGTSTLIQCNMQTVH